MKGYTIGEALDTFEAWLRDQREAERDELPRPDALDEYAGLLSTVAHPPNECGDPAGCDVHSEQYRTYNATERH
jgi:hypothetical protein